VHHFLAHADLIFGIGCSFATTNYGVAMPPGKLIIHATLDPADINKDLPADHALVGDAALTLEALLAAVQGELGQRPRGRAAEVAREIAAVRDDWLAQWRPKLTSVETPLSRYRVIWDLLHTVDVTNTIITHDAGSPRDQLSPFWVAVEPLSYIGWGKTTQLGGYPKIIEALDQVTLLRAGPHAGAGGGMRRPSFARVGSSRNVGGRETSSCNANSSCQAGCSAQRCCGARCPRSTTSSTAVVMTSPHAEQPTITFVSPRSRQRTAATPSRAPSQVSKGAGATPRTG
jgi:hypothetical protein